MAVQTRSAEKTEIRPACSTAGGDRRPPQAPRGDALARKETVGDGTQGVQLATMQELVRYWATEYDFEGSRRD